MRLELDELEALTISNHRHAPKDAALPARRREDLLRLVQQAGQATVLELAANFDVSADTIRRDIDQLAEHGLLARTHGGAVPLTAFATADTSFSSRMQTNHKVKAAIGRAVASLIQDDETVVLNGGTTTLAVGAALGEHTGLTIVTNNLLLMSVLPSGCFREMYVVGGGVRPMSMTTNGPFAFAGATGEGTHGISADVAVIGIGGISVSSGLSTSDMAEARMMRQMIGAARRLIVATDSSKADHNAFAHFCPLARIDWLVTDLDRSHPISIAVEEAGGEVVSVNEGRA